MLIHLHDDMEGREIETTLTEESLAGKEDRDTARVVLKYFNVIVLPLLVSPIYLEEFK